MKVNGFEAIRLLMEGKTLIVVGKVKHKGNEYFIKDEVLYYSNDQDEGCSKATFNGLMVEEFKVKK